jgi:hypothetical protein
MGVLPELLIDRGENLGRHKDLVVESSILLNLKYSKSNTHLTRVNKRTVAEVRWRV